MKKMKTMKQRKGTPEEPAVSRLFRWGQYLTRVGLLLEVCISSIFPFNSTSFRKMNEWFKFYAEE